MVHSWAVVSGADVAVASCLTPDLQEGVRLCQALMGATVLLAMCQHVSVGAINLLLPLLSFSVSSFVCEEVCDQCVLQFIQRCLGMTTMTLKSQQL